MIHRVITLLVCLILGSSVSLQAQDHLAQARQWCDTTTLDALEGIWLLPADRVYVLVQRLTPDPMSDYSLTVVIGMDGITMPGMSLGTMRPTADRKKVLLSLPVSAKKQQGATLRSCNLTIADNGYALVLEPAARPLRISFSPTSLLPGFWRMVRISLSPKNNETVQGMVKVYPSYDGNGSDRHHPRYL